MPRRNKGDFDARTRSTLMSIAYQAIREEKRNTTLVPARLLHHFLGFDKLIRPLDTVRVAGLRESMISEKGYRDNEPVFTTPPLFDLHLERYILGGNHRTTSFRNSGSVLIPSYVLSEKTIQEMMDTLACRMKSEATDAEKELTIQKKRKLFFRCVSLLMVATKFREPAPIPPTILQMVGLLRTYVRNDPDVLPYSRSRGAYGGLDAVQDMLFEHIPVRADGAVHYLQDTCKGRRHMNKLLRGSYILIETAAPPNVQGVEGIETILDLLLYWELCDLMPAFTTTHLAHVGSLSTENVVSIAAEAHKEIADNLRNVNPDPALRLAPYNTGNIREQRTTSAGVSDKREREEEDDDSGEPDVTLLEARTNDDEPNVADNNTPPATRHLPAADQEDGDDAVDEDFDEDDDEEEDVIAPRRSTRQKRKVQTYTETRTNPLKTRKITKGASQQIKDLEAKLRAAEDKLEKAEKDEQSRRKAVILQAESTAEEQIATELETKYNHIMKEFEESKNTEFEKKAAEREKQEAVQLQRLREENELLKKAVEDGNGEGGPSSQRARGKRVVPLSNAQLRGYSKQQLELLVARAKALIAFHK